VVLAEFLSLDDATLARAILERRDMRTLESVAVAAGMVPRRERARRLVAEGITSPAEIIRVLGTGAATPESTI
jgi:type II secretory ATPase GspE/PulE/Tfp pilus assembly ATPase PilB-like protein